MEKTEDLKNNKKHAKHAAKKKINKWLKVVLILLLVIVLSGIILVSKFIGDKLAKIKFQELDEKNLEINENLYKELLKKNMMM